MANSEAELSLLLKARNLASREVDRLHGSLTRVHGAAGALGGALKTLAAVGVAGLVVGIGAAVAFLGAATKAAADEQVGINRLNAALKANVKGFDGNTAAIEAVIKKREDLAFSDDDLRASLSTLVAKYKDVKKAEDIQRVAMDVARLKGISLADATVLVSKGMDGNAKILKQLGIELPKTATEQDRLTAIQKIAAGQAEAYAKGAIGGQEAFSIALQDVTEDIGSGLLPVMTEAMAFLKDTGIPAIRGIAATVGGWIEQNRPLLTQIKDVLVKALGTLIEKLSGVVTWIGSVIDAITSNKEAMNFLKDVMQNIGTFVGIVGDALSTMFTWAGQVFDTLSKNQTVLDVTRTAFKLLGQAVGTVVDAFRWLLDNAGKVIDTLSHLSLPDVTGITDLIPHFDIGGRVPGPVGAPLMAVVHGGEYVDRTGGSRGATVPSSVSGVILQGVTQRDILRMVDEGMFFRLQRAPSR